VPGGSSPAALQLRGKNYPLPLSGSLWINARTGSITKLVAEVDSSLSDLGLKGLRSEIHYATVNFHDPDESYWMPVSATIDVETPRQHWRNLHSFSNYRRFRASIQVVTGESHERASHDRNHIGRPPRSRANERSAAIARGFFSLGC